MEQAAQYETNKVMLKQWKLPLAICSLLIILFSSIYSQNLSSIRYVHYDDFFTLERSKGFTKHNDWLGVYSQNKLTSKKPPLQYWINAALFKTGMSEIFAVRITSFTFYVGILIIGGLFATALAGGNLWAGAACITMIGCSNFLIKNARTGLLDTGMVFFILSALYFLYLAQKNNKAWILCGLMIGLGALQKNPVSMGFVFLFVIYLAIRGVDTYKPKHLAKNQYFFIGFAIAVALILVWPLIQYSRLGSDYLSIYFQHEMATRFTPVSIEQTSSHDPFKWVKWLRKDLRLFHIITLLCLIAVLFNRNMRNNPFLGGLALLAGIIIATFSLTKGHLSWRYTSVLTPFLIIVATLVINHAFKKRHYAVFLVVGLLALSSIDNIARTIEQTNSEDNLTSIERAVALIDEHRREGDQIVFDREIIPGGAYGFLGTSMDTYRYFSSKKSNVKKKISSFLGKWKDKSSLIGVTREADHKYIQEELPNLEVITTENGIVLWRHTLQTKQ